MPSALPPYSTLLWISQTSKNVEELNLTTFAVQSCQQSARATSCNAPHSTPTCGDARTIPEMTRLFGSRPEGEMSFPDHVWWQTSVEDNNIYLLHFRSFLELNWPGNTANDTEDMLNKLSMMLWCLCKATVQAETEITEITGGGGSRVNLGGLCS